MNQTRPLPTLHQLLDAAIKLDESLQRAIRQVRTLSHVDTPANLNSPLYASMTTLLNALTMAIGLTVTIQLLTKQGVGNDSS